MGQADGDKICYFFIKPLWTEQQATEQKKMGEDLHRFKVVSQKERRKGRERTGLKETRNVET